jgi:hypothetical protein
LTDWAQLRRFRFPSPFQRALISSKAEFIPPAKQKGNIMDICRQASLILFAGLWFVSNAAVEVQVDRVVHTGIKAIDIDAKCLEIEIVGHDGDSLVMEGAKIGKNVLVKSRKKASVLTVWIDTEGPAFPWDCVGKILLTVPQETSLKCKTNSGSLSIESVQARAIGVTTVSGNIEIENCSAAMAVKSTSGRIELDSCNGKKSIEAVSGSMSVENSKGDIYAASVSGMLEFEGIDGNLEAKSVSGMIRVEEQKGRLALRSVSGALSGEEITAQDSCIFETKSGSIDMDFTNPLDQFRFELKSLSGNLEAGDISGDKKLSTGTGTILIKGETLSGAQNYE